MIGNKLAIRAGSLLVGVSAVLGLAAPRPLTAAEFQYGFNVGVGHSDNIGREAVDKVDETVATAGVAIGLEHDGRRLDANVFANLAYFDYLDQTFEREVRGSFNGDMRLALIPERIVWVVEDNFGQIRRTLTSPETPDNREDVNYLSTGPELTQALGSLTTLNLSGRHSIISYELSPYDHTRERGGIGLSREISADSSISINGNLEQVKFDEKVGSQDYQKKEAFLRLDAVGSRTQLLVDLGYNRISDLEDFGLEYGGAVGRLTLSRRLTPSATLSLQVGRELTDAANLMRLQQGFVGVDLATQAVDSTSEPFQSQFGIASWNYERDRTGIVLNLSYFNESYEQRIDRDRTRKSADFRVRRQLSSVVSAQFIAGYTQEDFVDPNPDFDELDLGLDLSFQLSRQFRLSAQYLYFDRNSDASFAGFKENMVWLRLGYGNARLVTGEGWMR